MLPDKEYKALVAQQNLERVCKRGIQEQESRCRSQPGYHNRHREHSTHSDITKSGHKKHSGSTAQYVNSPKHSTLIPRQSTDTQLQKSQLAHATRKALSSGFNPLSYFDEDKENYYGLRVSSSWDRGFEGMDQRHKSIPQKYIDEFNQMWHEEDEDRDADQYLADLTPNAAWRAHVRLEPMRARKRAPLKDISEPLSGCSEMMESSVRSELKSQFSWSTLDSDEEEELDVSTRDCPRHAVKRGLGRK